MDLLRANVELNGLGGKCRVSELDWETCEDAVSALGQGGKPPDAIVCADVLYTRRLSAAFGAVVRRLLERGTRACFMAHELREESPACFEELRRAGIVYGKLPDDCLHPDWNSGDIGTRFCCFLALSLFALPLLALT